MRDWPGPKAEGRGSKIRKPRTSDLELSHCSDPLLTQNSELRTSLPTFPACRAPLASRASRFDRLTVPSQVEGRDRVCGCSPIYNGSVYRCGIFAGCQ